MLTEIIIKSLTALQNRTEQFNATSTFKTIGDPANYSKYCSTDLLSFFVVLYLPFSLSLSLPCNLSLSPIPFVPLCVCVPFRFRSFFPSYFIRADSLNHLHFVFVQLALACSYFMYRYFVASLQQK